MNPPIPAETAYLNCSGIASITFCLKPVRAMSKNNNPLINTAASANCHVLPKTKVTVKAKKALIPMPGASAIG